MKLLRISIFLSLVIWCASNAWGQLGLYGSPEPLQLPQTQPASYGAPVTTNSYGVPVTTNARPGMVQPSGYVPMQGNSPRPYYQASAPMQPASRPYYMASNQIQPAPTPAAPRAGGYRTPTPAMAPPGMPALGRTTTAPSAANSMMNEPPPSVIAGNGGYGGCNGCEGSQCGGLGCYSGCDDCGGICFPWYASLRTLVMTRDKPNTLWTSAEMANPTKQGHFDDFDWRWGGEVTVGRHFNSCGAGWSIEATYWTLDEFSSEGGPGIAGPYVTPLFMWGTEVVGTGTMASDWFNGSPDHRIARTDEVHNVEINLFRNHLWGEGCQPLNVDVFIGARYFRFRDPIDVQCAERQPGHLRRRLDPSR